MNSGKNVILTEQDLQLLEHLARYRVTLTRIAHQEVYPERTLKKAWTRLDTLGKAGYIAKHSLPITGKYWTLGSRGIAQMAAKRNWDKPLNFQALKKWLTVLLFCFDGKTKRCRLNAFEMQGLADGFYHKQLFEGRGYCLQRDGDVDRIVAIKGAGDNSPYTVACRCREELTIHIKYPAFETLLQEGRFVIAVVVSTKWQVKPVRRAIEKHFSVIDDSAPIKPKFKVYLRARLADLIPVKLKASNE